MQSVTLHTTVGDVKIEVCCDTAPHAAEVGRDAACCSSCRAHSFLMTDGRTDSLVAATQNFLALCACGAYDGTKFHRFVRLRHASCLVDISD